MLGDGRYTIRILLFTTFFQIILNLENIGEDQLSFQEHITVINAELRKRQPDYTNIKNRMRCTLFKRVDLMTKSTREVMDMFPFLRVPQLVSICF